MRIADFTADGIADVFVERSDNVGYYPGDGIGGFGPFVPVPLVPGLIMAIADLNGDGASDIVSVAQQEFGVDQALFWSRNEGAGTFAPEETIITSPQIFAHVVPADLDGDGDQDLFYTTQSSPQPYRELRGLMNEGAGQWTNEAYTYDSENSLMGILRDVDGRDEGVGRSSAGYFTMRWNADSFTRTTIPMPEARYPIQIADLNGDGHEDLLIGNNAGEWSIMLRAQDGTGWMSAVAQPAIPMFGYESWVLGDMDADGDVDVLCSIPGDLFLLVNDGSGLVYERVSLAEGFGTIWFGRHTDTAELLPITDLVDIDADGDLDALGPLFSMRNDGTGVLTGPHALHSAGSYMWSRFVFHDLDGDGYDDAIGGDPQRGAVWFKNLGDGSFAGAVTLLGAMANDPTVRVYDLDGDGLLDITFENKFGGSIAWARNQGNDVFSAGTVIINLDDGTSSIIDLADTDSDGDGDIIYFTPSTGLHLLTNEGNGSFSDSFIFDPGYAFSTAYVEDINGDGSMDIMTKALEGPYIGIHFLYNNGDGTWAEPVAHPRANSWWGAPLVDIDGDGDQDLIIHLCDDCAEIGYPDLAWTENLGDGAWSELRVIDLPIDAATMSLQIDAAHFADVDQDGDMDALISRERGAATGLYFVENLGGGVFAPRVRISDVRWVDMLGTANLLGGTPALDVVGFLDIAGVGYPTHYIANENPVSYQLRGHLFVDTNENGTRDLGEPPVPGRWIHTQPTSAGSNTFGTGEYAVLCSAGAHTIVAPPALFANGTWGLTTAGQHNAVVDQSEPVSSGHDFGIKPLVDRVALEVTAEYGESWCGGVVPVWYTVTNIGTRTEGGIMRLSLDPRFSFASSFPADAVLEDTEVVWSFGPLAPFQRTRFLANLVSPDFQSAGTEANFMARVQTVDMHGSITGLFLRELKWRLECAYDPNDKKVSPQGYGAHGAIAVDSTHLEYTIRFQNTGTAPAYNITLRDQLASELDPESIEVLAASHAVSRVVVSEDREMEVLFLNIMLPDSASDPGGSQGYVRFRIALHDGLTHATPVQNSADIFFDLNPAIVTNTTLTTLVDCQLWEPIVENPANDVLQATEGDQYQWFLNGDTLHGATERWLTVAQLGAYHVAVTSMYGCSATSATVSIISLQIPEQQGLSLFAHPNPFSASTTIRASKPFTTAHTITLCDAQGRVLHSMNGNGSDRIQIQRGQLAAGLYVVNILSAMGSTEARLRLMIE